MIGDIIHECVQISPDGQDGDRCWRVLRAECGHRVSHALLLGSRVLQPARWGDTRFLGLVGSQLPWDGSFFDSRTFTSYSAGEAGHFQTVHLDFEMKMLPYNTTIPKFFKMCSKYVLLIGNFPMKSRTLNSVHILSDTLQRNLRIAGFTRGSPLVKPGDTSVASCSFKIYIYLTAHTSSEKVTEIQ